jgi:putative membrane protein
MTESAQQKQIKTLNRLAWVVTFVVWLLVGAMRRYKFDVPFDLSFLAGLNALFNTGVTVALLCAYYFIRRGEIMLHRRSMYIAMSLSAGFLLSYVGYHFTTEEIIFCKEGFIRKAYYFVLFSHIVLAGLSLPFILLTFIRGYTGDYKVHKRMARWVFPFWLYVAATGPVIYFMLLPCR